MTAWPAEAWRRFGRFYHKDIWQPTHLKDKTPRGWLYAFLRVVSITGTVFRETRAASRAASLTFSSLLGLGPLVAIAVLAGGLVLGNKQNPHLVADKLSEVLHFLAPQINTLEAQDNAAAQAGTAPAAGQSVNVAPNPELVGLINGFIAGARSGSASAFGIVTLVIIVLLLFKTIEDAFNEIWGVRVGRSVMMRVVFYWTILSLGAVLFIAAITLLGANAFVNVFRERISAQLPYGTQLLRLLSWSVPVVSLSLLIALLTVFYRVIPNTRVYWRAAFCGALVVAALLMLNNFVALLYVRRVYLERSLYGSLGIVPVLMLGLYIFWLYVLTGGIISYAVQNVHFRNSQAAWSRLTKAIRERLLLVVLLTIARRFQACLPPVSALQLSPMIKVPTQILNECLNHLVDMKLITPVPAAGDDSEADSLYQPARPLSRITLFEFKSLDENLGEDPIGGTLERIDPILLHYNAALQRLGQEAFFKKSLEELLTEHPFDESRPPFSTLVPP